MLYCTCQVSIPAGRQHAPEPVQRIGAAHHVGVGEVHCVEQVAGVQAVAASASLPAWGGGKVQRSTLRSGRGGRTTTLTNPTPPGRSPSTSRSKIRSPSRVADVLEHVERDQQVVATGQAGPAAGLRPPRSSEVHALGVGACVAQDRRRQVHPVDAARSVPPRAPRCVPPRSRSRARCAPPAWRRWPARSPGRCSRRAWIRAAARPPVW